MTSPRIACLCPTYKRPRHLRNAIACFVSQTHSNKRLLILDDAGQHTACDYPAEGWRLLSQSDRYPNLPAKLNAMAAMAPEADILAVWEDDDIYLPHHLASIADAYAGTDPGAYFAPSRVLSTYNMPFGRTRLEGAAGRFHGSWAYTRRLWESLGGYELADRLDFDQHMGRRCQMAAPIIHYDETGLGRTFGPSYVYRWANGVYHGSQAGEEGYAGLWRQLDELPYEQVERTGALMDDETRFIYALHGWRRCGKCGVDLARSENTYCAACMDAPVRGTTVKSFYSPATKATKRKSICLVMLIKDESAIIRRCLESVRTVIDTWLIMDTGSTDKTAEVAQDVLKGIPGEWLSQPMEGLSTNRNQLLERSRRLADYSLWLDADETLIFDSDAPWHGLTSSVYGIELQTPRGSFMPPRLLHRSANAQFVGTIAETLVASDEIVPLNNVAIRHHHDGIHWRDATRTQRDILCIESELVDEPRNAVLTLALAERLGARGEVVTALHYYRRRAELGGDPAQTWYALYQAARILDDRGFATPLVVEAYFAAYDFRPTKAEPLVRIARRCLQEGRNDTAADIAWAAVTTPFEDRAYFFEPAVYRGERELMYLRAALELERYADVVACAETFLAKNEQTLEIRHEIDELRSLALKRQSHGHRNHTAQAMSTVAPTEAPRPMPSRTPRRDKRKLCIGMATYDDYDGVYFSVQAIRLFHPEVSNEIEFLVIDNNPTGRCAEGLKALDAWVPNYRYVPEAELRGTAARDVIFREANSDYVLVMDCHVLLVAGALRRLLEYFDAAPHCKDLLQGPLVYDDLNNISTHFAPVWRGGMYGIWDTDPRGRDVEAPPFEIPMQGLGVFACRRDAWPGFNPRFRGFGGEEGYIHEKFRQAGSKVFCLPFLRWIHRFHRPLGLPYAANWFDRVRNYLIGHDELGLDPLPIETHFNELLGAPATASYKARVEKEIQSPLYKFDGIYFCRAQGSSPTDQTEARESLERLGVRDRVIETDVVCTGSAERDHRSQLARILTHRSIIDRARRQGMKSVVIVESATDFESAVLGAGADRIGDLHSRPWSVYRFETRASQTATCFDCATAYHISSYDSLLAEIPEQPDLARRWMNECHGSFNHLRVDEIIARHQKNVVTVSDINEHLETIRRYAGLSSHVTEMGVRNVVSTWSLLAGKPTKAVSYDTYRSPSVDEVQAVAEQYGIEFEFVQKNVLDVEIEPTDLLFIDTEHTYEQLKSELGKHGEKSRKYIILHDTATFADVGANGNAPGLQAAIDEFLAQNPQWQIAECFSNNNGLTCLARRS